MDNHIRYKGKGEHSVSELEKIIERQRKELSLLRSDVASRSLKTICECTDEHPTERQEFSTLEFCTHCKLIVESYGN